jgi:hypothetical protein
MNRKILAIIGVVILAVVIFFVLTRKGFNKIVQNPQDLLKKEMSVGTDICDEFPKDWVAAVIGKTIVRIKPFSMKGTNSCDYFINETDFAGINVDDLSVETQKKGVIQMGNTVKTDQRIPMDHFIVVRPDGSINSISLVLNPNKFVTIDRFYGKVFDNEGVTAFAIKVAQRIQNGENVTTNQNMVTTTVTTSSAGSSAVPLPAEKDIVNNFFNLINEGKISDAVNMMTPANTSDDSNKQAWGVQFNAFKSISVVSVDSSMPEEWTSNSHVYKVTLDVKMKPESENAQPMPYYGWGNGQFIRWITLEKVNNFWKVGGISTGP